MKTIRRRHWAAALAVLPVVLIAGTGTAQAGLRQFQDGFESNPGGKWITQTVGNAGAGFDFGQGIARSGSNNGWLHAGTQGFSAMGIWVSTGSSGTTDCIAQIYANPLNDRSKEINIGVRDSSGNLINNVSRNLSFTGYQPISTDWFQLNGYQSVFVNFTVGDSGRGYDGEWVRLDDFILNCYY